MTILKSLTSRLAHSWRGFPTHTGVPLWQRVFRVGEISAFACYCWASRTVGTGLIQLPIWSQMPAWISEHFLQSEFSFAFSVRAPSPLIKILVGAFRCKVVLRCHLHIVFKLLRKVTWVLSRSTLYFLTYSTGLPLVCLSSASEAHGDSTAMALVGITDHGIF